MYISNPFSKILVAPLYIVFLPRPTSRAASLKGDVEMEKKGDNYRSSLYVEPSDEEGTQI